MSQNKIPDFTETEFWAMRTTLKERYGKEIEPQRAGGAGGMAWCPALFWSAKGANFTINEITMRSATASSARCRSSPITYGGKKNQRGSETGVARRDTPDKPDTSPLFWGE